MTHHKENLKQLRSAISAECELRMERDHGLDSDEVAAWCFTRKRDLTLAALSDLVCQAMEQRQDERRVERMFKEQPELREWEPHLRKLSEQLGIPLRFLYELKTSLVAGLSEAMQSLYELRIRENQSHIAAMKAFEERIAPVTNGHPEMTAGEALKRLEQQTDETIRKLDDEENS